MTEEVTFSAIQGSMEEEYQIPAGLILQQTNKIDGLSDEEYRYDKK